MREVTTLILERDDMAGPFKKKDFNDIEFPDFKMAYYKPYVNHDIVLFIDDDHNNLRTKIMKNRYGN